MSFLDLAQERQSVRAFKSQAPGEGAILQILQAIALAPSAGNLQAYEVVIVRDGTRRKALADAAWNQEFIAQAPVILVFLADPGRSTGRYGSRGSSLYSVQDATIAASYAQLAATDLGLATVWVGAFQDEHVRNVVCAPSDLVPVCILPIGYPNESPPRTPRRKLENLVKEENFANTFPERA